MSHTAPTTAWPLTGREAELDAIAAACADRESRGVIITAAAGAGKSRLAHEAVASAEHDGALVEWIQATRSAAAVPLGAVAALLPEEIRSEDTLALMRSSATALRERSRGRRIVLGVDDAQRLDPVSAALVLHLVTNADVFVIATVRTGEPCPDAVESLWKDAGARRLELRRLDDKAVAELVERGLGSAVEAATQRWVTEAGEGNPLYVRELVLGALDAGTLRHEDGLWRLVGRPAISPSLVEVVSQRLSGLEAEQREPLELLALAEPLRVPELASLTSYDALADAEARGLVAVDSAGPGGELRLAHPLFGDVVANGLSGLRARRLRLALAQELQRRTPLTSQDARRIARLLFDAGAELPSALVLDAAHGASLAGDADLTRRLATRSLVEGGGLEAAVLLARADVLCNRPEAAAATLAEAESLAPGSPVAGEYLRLRVRVLYWALRRSADAAALLQRAAGWSDDPEWRATVERQAVVQQQLRGDVTGTVQVSFDDPNLERLRAMMLLFNGRPDDAYRVLLPIRPKAPFLDEGEAATEGTLYLAALLGGADLAGFETGVRRAFTQAVTANDHQAAGLAAYATGAVLVLRGAYEAARRWCAEAASHLRVHDVFRVIVHVHALEVSIAHFTGADVQTAIALVRDAVAGRELLPTQRACVLHAEGYSEAGGERMLDAARELADQPGYACELAYAAMLAGAPGAVDAVLEYGDRSDGRLMSAYTAHAAARRDRDATALLAVAETFAAIGTPPFATAAAVDAAGVLAAAGDTDAARRAAARARELHVPGEGVEPPRVPGLESVAIELTAREAQLVELVRGGLSNGEIAERLVVSVRTVESHLYRAMNKLGVSDRHDL